MRGAFLYGLGFVYLFYEKIHVCGDENRAIDSNQDSEKHVENYCKACPVKMVQEDSEYYHHENHYDAPDDPFRDRDRFYGNHFQDIVQRGETQRFTGIAFCQRKVAGL